MKREELWERLTTYEFPRLRPDDVRDWLGEDGSDDALAEALAQIANRVQILRPGVESGGDPLLKKGLAGWEKLEEELTEAVFSRLRARGTPAEHGDVRTRLLAFMAPCGWRDDSGWWLRNEETRSGEGE